MICHLNPTEWQCPDCGGSEVKENCCWYAGEELGWVTRKDRENPKIMEACLNATVQPLMWVSDSTWATCAICGRDLDANEAFRVHTYVQKLWGKALSGEIPLIEEIGTAILNSKAISKINTPSQQL